MYRVFESLDALVTVVEEARGVPMTSNCVVPRGEVLELLDDVREALPAELDDAQDVLDRRDELVDEAAQEAEHTRSTAESESEELRANARAEADRMVAAAREEAEQMVAQARHEAERAVAEGRRQFQELTDRAHAEAERHAEAGRSAHDRYLADGQAEQARLVAQTEVVRAAHAESARIVDDAENEAGRLAVGVRRIRRHQAGRVRGHPRAGAAHRLPRSQPAVVGRSRAGRCQRPVGDGHGSDRLITPVIHSVRPNRARACPDGGIVERWCVAGLSPIQRPGGIGTDIALSLAI